jgi:hypothetical protein
MHITDKVSEALAKLKEKRAKIKAKERILESRHRAHLKMNEERKWYLIGEVVSKEAARNVKTREWLKDLLHGHLIMDRDRALFELGDIKLKNPAAEPFGDEGTP